MPCLCSSFSVVGRAPGARDVTGLWDFLHPGGSAWGTQSSKVPGFQGFSGPWTSLCAAEQEPAAGHTIVVLSFTCCHKIGMPSFAEVIVLSF